MGLLGTSGGRLDFYATSVVAFITVSLCLNVAHLKSVVPKNLPLEDGLRGFLGHNFTKATSIPSWRQSNTSIPPWMAEYFDWHRNQTSYRSQWKKGEPKLAIVACLDRDVKCGGASDRLQVLPWAILLAARSQRVLLFRWERPCPLEEFLLPNEIDWSVPNDLWVDRISKWPNRNVVRTASKAGIVQAQAEDAVVYLQQQSTDHGATLFQESQQSKFYDIYRPAFEVFFKISPPVQALINENMKQLGLQPGKYIAVHTRQKYIRHKYTDGVGNSIRCAYSRRPGIPIYFASDSPNATTVALQYGRHVNVVARPPHRQPLHLDRGSEYLAKDYNRWTTHEPEEYYDIFVDLFLLGQAQCVVYGVGGYGQLASAFSADDCSFRHTKTKCTWSSWNTTEVIRTKS